MSALPPKADIDWSLPHVIAKVDFSGFAVILNRIVAAIDQYENLLRAPPPVTGTVHQHA
jgi:hypothetical protein